MKQDRTEQSGGRGAVFLDRDGTLIEEVHYLRRSDQIHLLEGAAEALRLAQSAGLATVLITNQSAVGRGYLPESGLREIHQHLNELLEAQDTRLDGIYYCPHHPEADLEDYRRVCPCRKPNPGMLLQAVRDLNLDPEKSLMVGDTFHDIEAGRRAGCRTALVQTGYGAGTWRDRRPDDPVPDLVASSLLEAVRWFLGI